MLQRPSDLFDREWEWDVLTRFVAQTDEGATLGVVSGRRRQGKTTLLQALCEATGGLFHEAVEGTSTEALDRLGRDVARHARAPGRVAFDTWEQALDALLALGEGSNPVPVVLDELPYLLRVVPGLASIVQAALAPRSPARRRSRTRLVLCGSALTVMGRLLAGTAPLRGRAGLELVVGSFPYRVAADFWGLRDHPALALRVDAIVGGTPAYRREFVGGDAPGDLADFDAWVVRSVLNPALPLLREGRHLLAEEPELRDVGLYAAVLGAVASGAATRTAIASRLGRTSNDLAHPLRVLEDAGFLRRDDDAFRRGRPTYRVAEPYVRFHAAVVRPRWSQLSRPGRASQVWQEASATFSSQVLGPHFEQRCREWVAEHASPETTGGRVTSVTSAVLADPGGRTRHELDVVGLDAAGRPLIVGEAKVGTTMGMGDLARLRRLAVLLERRSGAGARLLCCSAAGFSPELRAEGRAGRAVLLDLERLYQGE